MGFLFPSNAMRGTPVVITLGGRAVCGLYDFLETACCPYWITLVQGLVSYDCRHHRQHQTTPGGYSSPVLFPRGPSFLPEFEGFLSDSSFPQWAHLWLMTEHGRTNGEGTWFLWGGGHLRECK